MNEQMLIGLLIVNVITFSLIIMLMIKLNKLTKVYKRLFKTTNKNNLDELIMELQENNKKQEAKIFEIQKQNQQISDKISDLKANIGITRYSAFADGGNDLSFSIAIINEKKTGVVMTSLFNREQAYLYAKPVDLGESVKYQLSPEEQKAIELAGKSV